MSNKVFLIGNVGKDAKLLQTNGGHQVCKVSLATTEGYGDKKRTQWHSLVAWGKMALAMSAVKKGEKIAIEGRISYRQWEKDGVTHYGTDIIVEQFVGNSHKDEEEISQYEQELFGDGQGY